MSVAVDLIDEAEALGVTLSEREGKIIAKPAVRLPVDLADRLRQHRDAVLGLLATALPAPGRSRVTGRVEIAPPPADFVSWGCSTAAFLDGLEGLGWRLAVAGGEISFDAPADAHDQDMVEQMRDRSEALAGLLRIRVRDSVASMRLADFVDSGRLLRVHSLHLDCDVVIAGRLAKIPADLAILPCYRGAELLALVEAKPTPSGLRLIHGAKCSLREVFGVEAALVDPSTDRGIEAGEAARGFRELAEWNSGIIRKGGAA